MTFGGYANAASFSKAGFQHSMPLSVTRTCFMTTSSNCPNEIREPPDHAHDQTLDWQVRSVGGSGWGCIVAAPGECGSEGCGEQEFFHGAVLGKPSLSF